MDKIYNHRDDAELMRPSLPEGLDEAAEKGAYKYCVDNKIGEYCGAAVYDAYEAGHKAGAKWMAGQMNKK